MAVEDVFGIVNSSCLNGFDFTLLSEEAILTILPLGISSTYSPSHSLPRFAFFPSLTSSYTDANNCQSAGRSCVFYALFWTLLIHYKWPFLAGVLPRLAYSGFLFAQPFLVERVLDFIDEAKTPTTNDTAYGLIGAYAVVYIGIAVGV